MHTEEEFGDDLENFIGEFTNTVGANCSSEEFIEFLREAFHEGIFDNEIKNYIYKNYSPSIAEDEIREQLTEELTEELRQEIKSELENERFDEIKEECEAEFTDKIRENFESILRGEKSGYEYQAIFKLAVQELKSILISKKEFLTTITVKIKSEILGYLKSGEVPSEYKGVISSLQEDLKKEMKNDKKITSKLTSEIMDDLTKSIFD